MSGSASTNTSAVDFEKQQAAEAAAKEAARQARLEQGKSTIDAVFSGQPVMRDATSNYDWSKFMPSTVDQMNAWRMSKGGSGAVVNSSDPTQYGLPSNYKITRGVGGAYGVADPSGRSYAQGQNMPVTTQVDTGQRTGGFNDAFYNTYKGKYLDYYLPDEAKQYAEAKRDLSYGLGNAGLLNSSVAADKAGQLAYADTQAQAGIKNQANAATGQLQDTVQQEKQSLINQLYATEDPTLTANLAQTAASGLQLKDPTTTPFATFFSPALTSVSSAATNLLSPYGPYTGQYAPQQNVGNPAPANRTSGNYSL